MHPRRCELRSSQLIRRLRLEASNALIIIVLIATITRSCSLIRLLKIRGAVLTTVFICSSSVSCGIQFPSLRREPLVSLTRCKRKRMGAAVRDIKSTFNKSRTKIWEQGSQRFKDGMAHSLQSCDEMPRIVVEPDSAGDVAKLLRIIKIQHEVKFALNLKERCYYFITF